MENSMRPETDDVRELSDVELETVTGGIVIGSLDAGSWAMLNPQPLPPIWLTLNPQPEPPGFASVMLSPQPQPN
jgi:hypothetical protein